MYIFRILLAALFFVTGCAAKYVEPEDGADAVSITFERSGYIGSSSTFAYLYSDKSCTKSSGGLVKEFYKGNKEPKTVQLLASQTAYVGLRESTFDSVAANSIRTTTQGVCRALASFVPEVTRSYRAYALVSHSHCAIVVVDEDTDRPVASFRPESVPDDCVK